MAEKQEKHELFEELEAFDIKWQMRYATVAKAAQAAKVLPLYADWLRSADGVRYCRLMQGVEDRQAAEAAERRLREKMQAAVTGPLFNASVDMLEDLEERVDNAE